MGWKLSAAQLGKLELLKEAERKWDRVRKLVELAAVSPKEQEELMHQCHRTASEIGRLLVDNAFGALSTYAIDMAFLIKRPGMFQLKLGAMREALGSGYVEFDREALHIQQS